MTQSDAALNALDWMARGALVQSGLAERVVDSTVGPQTFFAGGAGAPLVFLHGAGDHAGSWVRVAPLWMAKYRVLVVDGAGRGASGPYEGPLGMECMLAGLDAVLAAGLATDDVRSEGGVEIAAVDLTRSRGGAEEEAERGKSEPESAESAEIHGLRGRDQEESGGGAADGPGLQGITFVGNSLGAWVAMVWAVRHAERVKRIVAVNGGPVRGLRPDLTLTPADRDEARRLWEAMVDPSHSSVPEMVLDELIRKGRVGSLARFILADMEPYLMDGRLAEITVPVDLVWGESDGLIPLEYARKLEQELPRARLTTISGCGHIPQLECPERLQEVLQAVLGREP